MTNRNLNIGCWQCGRYLFVVPEHKAPEKRHNIFCSKNCEEVFNRSQEMARIEGLMENFKMGKTTTNYATLERIAITDTKVLIDKGRSYGDSWIKRGGVGAFMMLARKWDRIEQQCSNWEHNYDIMEDYRNDK